MVLPHTFIAIDLYYKWYKNSDDRSLKALKLFQEGYFIILLPSPAPLFMLLRILSFRFQPLICPSCLFTAWATSPLGRPGRPSLNVPKASPYCTLNHQPAPLSPSVQTSNSPSGHLGWSYPWILDPTLHSHSFSKSYENTWKTWSFLTPPSTTKTGHHCLFPELLRYLLTVSTIIFAQQARVVLEKLEFKHEALLAPNPSGLPILE